MAAMIKIDLLSLWHKKERELGRDISYQDVADATKVGWRAIAGLKRGETSRFDAKVLAALCEYFGVPEGPIPFLTVEYTDNGEGQ